MAAVRTIRQASSIALGTDVAKSLIFKNLSVTAVNGRRIFETGTRSVGCSSTESST